MKKFLNIVYVSKFDFILMSNKPTCGTINNNYGIEIYLHISIKGGVYNM